MGISSKRHRKHPPFGVNLGNWLVLERWMCGAGSPFEGTRSPDEEGLLDELGRDELERRLRAHRDSFLNERTFDSLADHGVDLLRLPIPYWAFGDEAHDPCIDRVDWALDRATDHGQRVLIDIHTVPGGQNGSDSSGICGLCTWHLDEAHVEKTLGVVGRLANRYGGHPGLFGIEPVNEPANDVVFSANMSRWAKAFPERAAASQAIPRNFLERFYLQAYELALPALDKGAALVLHDRFDDLSTWDDFMPCQRFGNVWIDTHRYLVFSGYAIVGDTARKRAHSHRRLIRDWSRQIRHASRFHNVLVGEWGLSHLVGATSDDTVRDLAKRQMRAWQTASGSCFWSLRCDARHGDLWSFEAATDHGWLKNGLRMRFCS